MKNPLDEHSDAAFFTRFGIVIFLLSALAVGFMAAGYAIEKKYQDPDTERLAMDADKRTKPVAQVITSNEQLAMATPAASASAAPKTGEQIVGEVCGACHNAGLLNAPKAHDKAAWQPRLQANGGKVEGLVASATKGKGSMPPKGGQPSLTDDDLKKAIQFMMN
ncbi:MAG TPA: c-type cytochrome [Nevskiaceae bacterium]|nr:c-type cytochrome [Nevskiaceae bacterium]